MKRTRLANLAELLVSVLLHAAVLAAFGAPVALHELERRAADPAKPESPRRSGNRERPGRHDASRRLDKELPKVRAEIPPEERKLVIIQPGAGLSDHDARATGGIPGLARPASADGPLGKKVLLPAFEPDQLENPKAAADRSTRRDEDRAPIQRPELDVGFGVFASMISAGQLQPDPGKPSNAPAQAQAQAVQAAALPKADPTPIVQPSSSALPPPPGAELAESQPERAKPFETAAKPQPLAQPREQPQGVERPVKEGDQPEEAKVQVATAPQDQQQEALFRLSAPLTTVRKPVERPDRAKPKQTLEDPKPKERHALRGQEKPASAEQQAKRPEEAKVEEKKRLEERRDPDQDEAASSVPQKSADGLWVAEGKSEQKRAESGAQQTPDRPIAEGKPQEQPLRLAMATTPRSPGAGEPESKQARIASEASPEPPRSVLTSAVQKLAVEAFEGGEEGARRSDRSSLAPAAPEKKLVGSETVEDHQTGDPQAGRIVIAPEGDGSGDDVGMASVAGNADLRHMVQERVNHVASLVGPGLVKRTGQRGIAVVRFRIDQGGYVRAVKLERSSGATELDQEIEAVLRLAEPYRGWRGWMRVAVCFGTPFIDF